MADSLSPAEMQFLQGQVSSRAVPPPSSSGALSQPELDFLTAKPSAAPATSVPATPAAVAPPPGDVAPDMATAFGTGVNRGLAAVVNAPSAWFGWKPLVDPNSFLTPGERQSEVAHPNIAGAGQATGEVIGTAPFMLGGEGLMGLAGVANPLVRGAAIGAGQNLLTAGDNPNESLWRRAALGAGTGAAGGYVGGWLGRQFGVDAALASQQVADAGRTMQNAGVDLTSANLPKAGAAAVTQGAPATVPQAQQVTKALGDIIGVNLPDVTPATLNAVKTTTGTAIGNAAARGSVDAGSILNDLANVETRATQAGVVNPTIKGILGDIQSKIGPGGIISGPDFQNLVRYSGDLDRATNSAVGDVREPAQQIEQLLNRGFAASSSPDVVAAYRTAKTQYKLALALEANAKQSAGDYIDPGRLYRNIASSLPDIATLGGGGPNPILDNVANFARAAETTFGGSAPSAAAAPASPLKWALGAAGLGAGGEAFNYLLHPGEALAGTSAYLAGHLPGALAAGGALAARQLGRWAGNLYQESPAFVNALIQRGTQPGRNLLMPWLPAAGTAAATSPGQGQ